MTGLFIVCNSAGSIGLGARLAVLGGNELDRQLGERHSFSLDRQLAELGVEDLLEVVTAGVGQLIAQQFELLRWRQVGAVQLGNSSWILRCTISTVGLSTMHSLPQ
jgi:hypothetical protein